MILFVCLINYGCRISFYVDMQNLINVWLEKLITTQYFQKKINFRDIRRYYIWHNVLLCKQVPQKKTEMVSDPSWQHCVVEQQCMLIKCTPYKKSLLVSSKLSNTFSNVLKPKVAILTPSISTLLKSGSEWPFDQA